MWFLNLETTHTNTTSTHWPRLISVSHAVINSCTYLLESLKTQLVLLRASFHSQGSLCVTLAHFSWQHIIIFLQKKSFLADFVRPSADKPNSSLLKVPCNTSRLVSLIPDHLTYQIIIFFFPKKDFLCIAHTIKQNVTNANCASLNCNKDIY